jgi:hypothetical protein
MGEGEARQGFPAPLFPFWEKGLGDEGNAEICEHTMLLLFRLPFSFFPLLFFL